jgi:hypothetical protein
MSPAQSPAQEPVMSPAAALAQREPVQPTTAAHAVRRTQYETLVAECGEIVARYLYGMVGDREVAADDRATPLLVGAAELALP